VTATATLVDTSVLLALLYDDDRFNDRSSTLLAEAASDGRLLINQLVYAELAADDTFSDRDGLDRFLSDVGIGVEPPNRDACFAAGEAFQRYLDRRGEAFECPSCGHETTVTCSECGETLTARQHIAADFLIGAQAEAVGRLLTFDTGFYRDYFDVEVLGPASS
jgi:predicted nucleic acid-binding protein